MRQQYDSYKPSGIDWIGDIPSHWNIQRLKFGMNLINGRAYLQPELLSEGKYRILRVGNFFTNDSWYYSDMELEDNKYCSKGDLLYAWSASIGPYIWNEEKVIFHYHIWKVDLSGKMDKKYSYYLLGVITKVKLNDMHGSAMQHLTMENMNNSDIIVPPLAEQEAIAAWLDEKCGEIDAAIAKVDREIELIDELKQSEISRVVTRGLNPDAPLRTSGIDWIGDIPEHWTKCRLKFIGSTRNGLTYSPSDVKDSGKLVIRSSNIQDSKLNYDDCVFVANYPETLSVNSGDTIICSRNGSINLIGKSVFIEDDMDVTFGAFMMRFRPYEHPKYSHYLLSIAISRYKGLFATTTINQLTADSLGKMEAVMPPYMEQVQIADYLDKKCAAIDGLKAKLTKKRETLTELRQSIISEVVTGKRKVI